MVDNTNSYSEVKHLYSKNVRCLLITSSDSKQQKEDSILTLRVQSRKTNVSFPDNTGIKVYVPK